MKKIWTKKIESATAYLDFRIWYARKFRNLLATQ